MSYIVSACERDVTIVEAHIVCVPGILWNLARDAVDLCHSADTACFKNGSLDETDFSFEAFTGQGEGRDAQLEIRGIAGFESGEPIVSWCARIQGCPERELDVATPPLPTRSPDVLDSVLIRMDQAMLYWLKGESELVHFALDDAQRRGVPVPVLYGLCTASMACRAILRNVCNYDARRVAEFDIRWSIPVTPGETVETTMWIEGDQVSFRCLSVDTNQVVIEHGTCKLHTSLLTTKGNA